MDEDIEEETGAVIVTNVYGDICFRKTRRKRQKALVREMFFDYANNTTLHGLSYTTKKGLTLIEKLFWLITFIGSFCLCCYLISNVYMKWKTSPVIVSVSEKLVSVRRVPFPSVTICPQSKSKVSAYNYAEERVRLEKILGLSRSEIEAHEKAFHKFDDVTNICNSQIDSLSTYPVEFSEAFPRNYSDNSVAHNIIDTALNIPDIFNSCEWRGQNDKFCHKTVNKILTSEGLCYNVNSLAASEIFRLENIDDDYPLLTANTSIKNWSLEHGYENNNYSDVYPVPGKENGAAPDLQIVLIDLLKERDRVCNVLNAGFKVYVQHPADLPQSGLYYYAVLNNQVSSMALSFSILNTSETLRKYEPTIRQCYFPNERYLKYFKIYTASNCRMECLANTTFNECGCVGFYMPRERNRSICTFQSTACMNRAREMIADKERNKEKRCLCLPACNSVDYEAEILKTDYNREKLIKETNRFFELSTQENSSTFSKLEMYFKRPRFVSMRRSELFGATDFLANIGGLLGLFLGFSFLSLVELFYFVTLRLCCVLKKDLKQEKIQRRNTIKLPRKF